MDWVTVIASALGYIEEHITDETLGAERVAQEASTSPFCFQRGFAMLCGFTVSEYIRMRRLALVGNDLAGTDDKVIDITLKYGYDSPDSFTKAFTRFHGVTPAAARKDGALLKSFAPLKIKFSLEGGYLMDCKIAAEPAFTVIGNAKTFSYEKAKAKIPKFRQEHFQSGKGAVVKGSCGINIDEAMSGKKFEYLIADLYTEGDKVPEGFELRTIPAFTWAVFPCVGALPTALQHANKRICTEWLPALKDYEFAAGYCVEYYDDPAKYEKGALDGHYYSEIRIPIRKK